MIIPYRAASALGAAALLSSAALAQPIWSNASPDPTRPALGAITVTQSGVQAPAFRWWSEAPSSGGGANAVAGFSSHDAGDGGFRFADDFLIPAGEVWALSTLRVYAYQPGAQGPSPFSGLRVRLWLGRPGDNASEIIWGDPTTNRMLSSTATNVLRVFSTIATPQPQPPDQSRMIWDTRASLDGVTLTPGHYWIEWQYTSINPEGGAFSPAATTIGSRGTGNAVQLQGPAGDFAGGWIEIVDPGKPASQPDLPQDLPFILEGFVTRVCDPDINCDGSVDQGDLSCLILAVSGELSCLCANDPDFNQDGSADQGDVADLVRVIAGWPCP